LELVWALDCLHPRPCREKHGTIPSIAFWEVVQGRLLFCHKAVRQDGEVGSPGLPIPFLELCLALA
jgi:hypothetical protein